MIPWHYTMFSIIITPIPTKYITLNLYKILQLNTGQTPTYLTSDNQLTADTGRPHLRSASERICVVPRTHNSLVTKVCLLLDLVCGRNALPSYLTYLLTCYYRSTITTTFFQPAFFSRVFQDWVLPPKVSL